MSKYQMYEDDIAEIIALSALLNAEIAGMNAANDARKVNGAQMAYFEHAFYEASIPLKNKLKSIERTP